MSIKSLLSMALTMGLLSGALGFLPTAQAQARRYYGHTSNYTSRYDHRKPMFSYKTGKILKGSLVGAGIGVGTGLLLDKNIGKTALVGAGLGAGTQALRYSPTLNRHPIVKTAGYGALTGVGVSALTRHGSLGKGAVIGGGLGAGLGALRNNF